MGELLIAFQWNATLELILPSCVVPCFTKKIEDANSELQVDKTPQV